jgi:hypothetical protein
MPGTIHTGITVIVIMVHRMAVVITVVVAGFMIRIL